MSTRVALPWRRLSAVALAVLAAAVSAAAATFEARVNAARIGLEDQLQLTITLADVSPKGEIVMPALTGLEVVAGPSVSTQVSFVNGAVSQSRSYIFVLRPTAVGQARIGEARVALADGERRTQAIDIEVVAGSVMPRRRPPADPFEEILRRDPFEGFFGRRGAPAAPAKVLMEAEASRRQVFVGEPVLVTFFLLTQTAVSGLDLAEAPSFSGFWVEELPRDETPPGETVTRGGESFQRFPVLRRLLYPTRAGDFTVPALSFRLALPRRVGFFADPGPSGAGMVIRATEPLQITVRAIPAGEEEYGGAVGSFRASTSVDRRDVPLGEAVQVRFVVEGNGNLKWVERAPQLGVAGARVYPPRVTDKLRVTPGGVSGERAWEFVVVPETAGSLEIPGLSFPFFDPVARQVRLAEAAPVPLTVRAPAAMVAGRTGAAPAQDGLALRADLQGSDVPSEPSPQVVVAVAALALLGHAVLLAAPLLARRRAAASGDQRRRRSARAILADLRRSRGPGLSKESAAALIERALIETFGDLEAVGEGENGVLQQAWEVLREARFVRYAPQLGEYREKLDELAERAAGLVRRGA